MHELVRTHSNSSSGYMATRILGYSEEQPLYFEEDQFIKPELQKMNSIFDSNYFGHTNYFSQQNTMYCQEPSRKSSIEAKNDFMNEENNEYEIFYNTDFEDDTAAPQPEVPQVPI